MIQKISKTVCILFMVKKIDQIKQNEKIKISKFYLFEKEDCQILKMLADGVSLHKISVSIKHSTFRKYIRADLKNSLYFYKINNINALLTSESRIHQNHSEVAVSIFFCRNAKSGNFCQYLVCNYIITEGAKKEIILYGLKFFRYRFLKG